eukprot:gene2862-biopygen7378
MVHAPPSPGFAVGDRVRCRNAGEEWMPGAVSHAEGPKVLPDEWGVVGLRPAAWDEVELLEPSRRESFLTLTQMLAGIHLDQFLGALERDGLATVNDLRFVTSPDDLPAGIPIFARRKLASHAVAFFAEKDMKEARDHELRLQQQAEQLIAQHDRGLHAKQREQGSWRCLLRRAGGGLAMTAARGGSRREPIGIWFICLRKPDNLFPGNGSLVSGEMVHLFPAETVSGFPRFLVFPELDPVFRFPRLTPFSDLNSVLVQTVSAFPGLNRFQFFGFPVSRFRHALLSVASWITVRSTLAIKARPQLRNEAPPTGRSVLLTRPAAEAWLPWGFFFSDKMVLLKPSSGAKIHEALRDCIGMTLETVDDFRVESPADVTAVAHGSTSLKLCFRADLTDAGTVVALAAPSDPASQKGQDGEQEGRDTRVSLAYLATPLGELSEAQKRSLDIQAVRK